MSYTSFAQKPHTSCPEMTSAAFVSRGTASFCFIFFPFPTELNHCLSAWKENKIVSMIRVSKKVLAVVQCVCSVFTSCLHATHANKLTEACVHTTSVAVWDFLTCLQLFLHVHFCNKACNERACWDPLTSLQPVARSGRGMFDNFYVSWCKVWVSHWSTWVPTQASFLRLFVREVCTRIFWNCG